MSGALSPAIKSAFAEFMGKYDLNVSTTAWAIMTASIVVIICASTVSSESSYYTTIVCYCIIAASCIALIPTAPQQDHIMIANYIGIFAVIFYYICVLVIYKKRIISNNVPNDYITISRASIVLVALQLYQLGKIASSTMGQIITKDDIKKAKLDQAILFLLLEIAAICYITLNIMLQYYYTSG
jgi:predicted neutral ceramidase superfamily lipid hydrolase